MKKFNLSDETNESYKFIIENKGNNIIEKFELFGAEFILNNEELFDENGNYNHNLLKVTCENKEINYKEFLKGINCAFRVGIVSIISNNSEQFYSDFTLATVWEDGSSATKKHQHYKTSNPKRSVITSEFVINKTTKFIISYVLPKSKICLTLYPDFITV